MINNDEVLNRFAKTRKNLFVLRTYFVLKMAALLPKSISSFSFYLVLKKGFFSSLSTNVLYEIYLYNCWLPWFLQNLYDLPCRIIVRTRLNTSIFTLLWTVWWNNKLKVLHPFYQNNNAKKKLQVLFDNKAIILNIKLQTLIYSNVS